MPIPKATDDVTAEWGVDFEGTCRIVTGATEVTDEVSPIPADAAGRSSPAKGRRKLYIRNRVETDLQGQTLFVGASDVTIDNGYPVYVNEMLELNVTDRVRVYGVTVPDFELDVRTLEVV